MEAKPEFKKSFKHIQNSLECLAIQKAEPCKNLWVVSKVILGKNLRILDFTFLTTHSSETDTAWVLQQCQIILKLGLFKKKS